MGRTATIQRLAWLITATSLALVVAGYVASASALVASDGVDWPPTHVLFNPIVTIAYALVGALVTSRDPRNPIGWIIVVIGLLSGLTFLAAVADVS